MLGMDKQIVISVKTILISLVFILCFYVLYELRGILGILYVSVLLVISMENVVRYFMQLTVFNRPLSRTASVLISYALFLMVLLLVLVTAIPMVIRESQRLVETFSFFFVNLEINDQNIFESLEFLEVLADMVHGGTITLLLRESVAAVSKFLTVIVLSIYMSLDWENLKNRFVSLFSSGSDMKAQDLIRVIEIRVGSWIKGQLTVMLAVGVLCFLSLTLLGVNYALALGFISAVFEIVPILGPIFASVVATAVGFSQSPTRGLLVLLFYIVIQQVESNYITPQVMKKHSGYSSLVILIALLIGHNFFGITGAILAIPTTMIAGILIERFTPLLGKD